MEAAMIWIAAGGMFFCGVLGGILIGVLSQQEQITSLMFANRRLRKELRDHESRNH
jgi:uncharacterized integral membrane protein